LQSSVDWHEIFSRESVDQCTHLFYDVIWSCFGSFVPKTSPYYIRKFPWATKKLNGLKNRVTTAAKTMRKSELVNDDIDKLTSLGKSLDFLKKPNITLKKPQFQ
jgi:hypothetical protein